MGKKMFLPEKIGMVTCSNCNSNGYIQNPKHQPCPKCGGFGFVKKQTERNVPIFTIKK